MSPYFEQTVMNAEPVELVTLLHQKAISCIREAREHLRNRRIADRARMVGDAYACIAELHGSLKADEAPELVSRLQALYLYMQRLLLEANAGQKDGPLAEVLALLTTLAEGWTAIARSHDARPRADREDLWREPAMDQERVYREALMA